MNDFRIRPNGNYIFNANWQELNVLTEHWKSDLLFYKDDLKFLDHLIDKYFIWISKKEDFNLVKSIEVGIVETSMECSNLLQRVNKHLADIAAILVNPFKYDSQKFREEHQQLEDDISVFIKLLGKIEKKFLKLPNM
jgi:hypothetical protein